MSKFGVSKVLPNLPIEKANKIVKYLRNDLGLENYEDLKYIEEHDLTKKNLLKPIPARKLIKYWNEEFSGNPSDGSEEGSRRTADEKLGKGQKKRKKKGSKKKLRKRLKTATPDNESTSSSESSSESDSGVSVKGHGSLAGTNKTLNYGVIHQNMS